MAGTGIFVMALEESIVSPNSIRVYETEGMKERGRERNV